MILMTDITNIFFSNHHSMYIKLILSEQVLVMLIKVSYIFFI